MALESEEPLDELEAARQLDERLELLRENHPRQMRLAVQPPRAVVDRLQCHPFAEDLGHRVHVVERRERGAHDEPPAALGPRPAPGRDLPDRKSTRLNSSHVAISYAVFCLK